MTFDHSHWAVVHEMCVQEIDDEEEEDGWMDGWK